MTLASATNRDSYTGNNSVSTYDYTFKVFDESELLVTVRSTADVETTLTLGVDYSTTGAGETDGGTIVLINASQAWLTAGKLTTGYKLVIRRVTDVTQETDVRNQGSYYPEGVEDEFDKLVMIDQQQQDELDRAVMLPETLTIDDFDPTLPADILVNGGSLIPSTNASGDGWALAADWTPVADLSAAVAAAAAAATSASAASTSAAAAATSASDALTSAGDAATSATAAAASATAAAATLTATTPTVSGSRASPISVTSAGITAVAGVYLQTWYIIGSPGAVDLTAVNPNISAVTLVGARIKLTGCDNTNTVTIFGNDTNKMITNGPRVLKDGSVWEAEWNGTAWQESSFNNL